MPRSATFALQPISFRLILSGVDFHYYCIRLRRHHGNIARAARSSQHSEGVIFPDHYGKTLKHSCPQTLRPFQQNQFLRRKRIAKDRIVESRDTAIEGGASFCGLHSDRPSRLLLAQSRHSIAVHQCPLSEIKRTWQAICGALISLAVTFLLFVFEITSNRPKNHADEDCAEQDDQQARHLVAAPIIIASTDTKALKVLNG
jgi:hypothetical protein